MTAKRWKPKLEEKYYFITLDVYQHWNVEGDRWDNVLIDRLSYSTGNCFATREEAKIKLRTLKTILKVR